ncbi:MAG TPA: DNA polymerase II [Vicinamibacteria bacterium]|nr:DNA polymerase II [Vicinamibacteria bacterium]
MAIRGFILEPTYRTLAGRAVVHLFGRLEDGRAFLVRDARELPRFYVETRDVERARALGASPLAPEDRVTLTGQPVSRVEVALPADAPLLRDRLLREGIACHEADVRFAMRYLIDHGIRGSLAIEGEGREEAGGGVVFDDPVVRPSDWTPRLRVLSLDIETDPQGRSVLSIALHGAGVSEVLAVGGGPGAVACASERELLEAFERRVRELDPDVLTGWNVVDFDFAVLARAAWRNGVPLALGRGPEGLRVRPGIGPRAMRQVHVPGRVVLDGIQLLRGAFVRMEDYGLDAVARAVLGEGKAIDGRRLAGGARAQEVLRLYREDRARFVEYNRTDARLALGILEKLRVVELAVERSLLTGMPLDRVSSAIAAFDFRYLTELNRRGVVAPTVGSSAAGDEPQAGGYVMEPVAGLHANVAVLDFRSLYPTVIRTFQIDPLNLVRSGPIPDALVAPSGAAFRRERGILTELLDDLMPRREAARRDGDAVKSHAIKILMNSFYGVLGTPACRFYDPRLANAITGFGQELLLWCRDRIQAGGRRVLYGDTDSLFVETGIDDPAAAAKCGARLATDLNRELAAHIRSRWQVESRLDLNFDRLYRRLFFPSMRHGGGGARKRYVGLTDDGRVLFTGMEAVRGDWTALARDVQRELYARLFADQPVDEWLRALVAELRAGRHDDRLVYRKSLRKAPESYIATTPPHVAAARKQGGRTRGRVAYLITTAGPEPAASRAHPIDHEHYVQKQVRAVAEPVLALLGLDFARVVGDERQLTLAF